ncbi:Serine/threonine-protein kinase MHK [Zea mays]|uniref:Serine/threonine-protein kinase MHK n=1 Tax=Zea mays TaxID=4577 RepID=A0A1D6LBU0_MAIZE|nr:Serine/threonine-protein kinase MHK [Zea mays]
MPCPALPRFASMDCSSSCSALPFFVSSPRGHRVNPGNSVPERACPPCSPAANLLCSVQWNFLLLMQPCIGGPSFEVDALSFEGGEGSLLRGSICSQ